jgi:hypothetical protein
MFFLYGQNFDKYTRKQYGNIMLYFFSLLWTRSRFSQVYNAREEHKGRTSHLLEELVD